MNIEAPIRRRSGLSEQVYEFVKDRLLDGYYSPNAWLPIDEISASLQVSRQPVMDSVRRLANEGLIEIVPQVGSRPRHYTAQEVLDYYDLFSMSEGRVVELAAERATASDVSSMKSLSAAIGELRSDKFSPQESSSKYRVLNRTLHRAFRQAAKSPAVAEVVERLADRSDYFVAVNGGPIFQERLEKAHLEHEAIINAIERQDARAAGAVMNTHILAIRNRIKAAIKA